MRQRLKRVRCRKAASHISGNKPNSHSGHACVKFASCIFQMVRWRV